MLGFGTDRPGPLNCQKKGGLQTVRRFRCGRCLQTRREKGLTSERNGVVLWQSLSWWGFKKGGSRDYRELDPLWQGKARAPDD